MFVKCWERPSLIRGGKRHVVGWNRYGARVEARCACSEATPLLLVRYKINFIKLVFVSDFRRKLVMVTCSNVIFYCF